MENKNEKIIKKIKGLLAISRDERNDEESQSAFVLAQRLMIQYSIDKSLVEGSEYYENDDSIDEASVTIFKKLYWWEKELAQIISKNFKVKNFVRIKGRKSKVVFFGFGRDLELAKEMFILAYDVILFHSKKFIDEFYSLRDGVERDRYLTASIKSSYINGFLQGLKKRFSEQIAELREVYEVLVLIPEEVEEAYNEKVKSFTGKSTYSIPNARISSAYEKGFTDGNSIDFTKRTIGEGEF